MEQIEAMYLGTGDIIAPTLDDGELAIVLDAVTRWTVYGPTTTLTYRYRNSETATTIRVSAVSKFSTRRHMFNEAL